MTVSIMVFESQGGQKMATPKILKLFHFSSDFDGVFSKGFLMKNVIKVFPGIFSFYLPFSS